MLAPSNRFDPFFVFVSVRRAACGGAHYCGIAACHVAFDASKLALSLAVDDESLLRLNLMTE